MIKCGLDYVKFVNALVHWSSPVRNLVTTLSPHKRKSDLAMRDYLGDYLLIELLIFAH